MAGFLTSAAGAFLTSAAGGFLVSGGDSASALGTMDYLYPERSRLDTTTSTTALSASTEVWINSEVNISPVNSVTISASSVTGATTVTYSEGTTNFWTVDSGTGVASAEAGSRQADTLHELIEGLDSAYAGSMTAGDQFVIFWHADLLGYSIVLTQALNPATTKAFRWTIWAPLTLAGDDPSTTLCAYAAEDAAYASSPTLNSAQSSAIGALVYSDGWAAGSHLCLINFALGRGAAHIAQDGPRITSYGGGTDVVLGAKRGVEFLSDTSFTFSAINTWFSGFNGSALWGNPSRGAQTGTLERRVNLIDWAIWDCGSGNDLHNAYLHDGEAYLRNGVLGPAVSGHSWKQDGTLLLAVDVIYRDTLANAPAQYYAINDSALVDISGCLQDVLTYRCSFIYATALSNRGPFSIKPRESSLGIRETPFKTIKDPFIREGAGAGSDFQRTINVQMSDGSFGPSNVWGLESANDYSAGATTIAGLQTYRKLWTSSGNTNSPVGIAETASGVNVRILLRRTSDERIVAHDTTATFTLATDTLVLDAAIPSGLVYESSTVGSVEESSIILWNVGDTPTYPVIKESWRKKYDASGNANPNYIHSIMTSGGNLDLSETLYYGRVWAHRVYDLTLSGGSNVGPQVVANNRNISATIGGNRESGFLFFPHVDPSEPVSNDSTMAVFGGVPGDDETGHSFYSRLPDATTHTLGTVFDAVYPSRFFMSSYGQVSQNGQTQRWGFGDVDLDWQTTKDFQMERNVLEGGGSGWAYMADNSELLTSAATRADRVASGVQSSGSSSIAVTATLASSFAGYAVLFNYNSDNVAGLAPGSDVYVSDDFAGGTTIPLVDELGNSATLTGDIADASVIMFVERPSALESYLPKAPHGYSATGDV